MIRVAAHPIVPPGMPGWARAWSEARGLTLEHPERWPLYRRAEYEMLTGETAPTRGPYQVACACHPLRLGLPMMKDEPWRTVQGATMTEKCLTWLRREFAGGRR